MAAVEGVEGLAVDEGALGGGALIEVGMIEGVILLEVGIVEDTGAGPGVMRHTRLQLRRMAVYWYCKILRIHLEGVLGFTWTPGFPFTGAFCRLMEGRVSGRKALSVWPI